jgi:outer membrane protein TolC
MRFRGFKFGISLLQCALLLHTSFAQAAKKKTPPPADPTPVAVAPVGPALTLKGAVDMALSTNPSTREIRERENQAQTEVPVARSVLMPNLSAVATANENKDATYTGAARFGGDSYNQYQTALKLNQLLFQIGSISAISAAKKDVVISKLNTQISNRDLMNSVIQAYFEIVLSARNVQTLLTQQKIAKEAVNVATRRERTGRGQLLDVLQAKTQLSLLDGQLATAQNQLSVSAAALANILGDTGKQNFNIQDKMDAPEIAVVDQNVNLKDYKIPEIERDEVSLQKVDDLKRTLWGQNLPYLNLVGNYNFTNNKQSDWYDGESNSWMIGLQLTIPIFSGLSTVYQSRSLDSQKLQFVLDKAAVENQVATSQITNRKNLETAKSSIVTGEDALKLALASSKEAQRNYTLATIDFLQFLSVQQAYVQAEQSLNTYKYNYIVALGNYYAASGQDMQQLVDLLEKANQ